MKRGAFQIGRIFRCGGRRWRCTDIGTRTIAAIGFDGIEVSDTDLQSHRTLTHADAAAEGWFNGPPYAVAEIVFDEDSMLGCSDDTDDEDAE